MPQLPPFKLERYFSKHEFSAPYLLCSSDVEPLPMADLLALADEESRALWQSLRLGYTETQGHPLLRAEIASLYQGVSADEVIVFAGAEDGIYSTMRVLCDAKSHVVAVNPAYQSLHEVARAQGASVTLVGFDADAILGAIAPETRVVVINTPHNPTGAHFSRADFIRIVDECEARGITLLCDEVYRLLEYDARARLPAAVERSGEAISVGVMSKAFGMAGVRIGWIATHDAELRHKLLAYKDYTSLCASGPSEILSIIALRAKERLLTRSRAIVTQNLARLDDFFARHAARLTWTRPSAGPVAFPAITDARYANADDFCAALVAAQGVLLAPGSMFSDDNAHTRHFRIGFGRTSLPEALTRLEHFLGD